MPTPSPIIVARVGVIVLKVHTPAARVISEIPMPTDVIASTIGRLMATAAPAGPAFEAASIRCGMRAAPGAVEVVTIDESGVHLQVIGDVDPVGLCGSGLVDAVAELARVGIIDPSGRYIPADMALERLPLLAPRITIQDGGAP